MNLPRQRGGAAGYQNIEAGRAELLATEDGGALVRLIAGEVAGYDGPVSTYTADHAGPRHGRRRRALELPWRPDYNALGLRAAPAPGPPGPRAGPMHSGQLALLGAGDRITVAADAHQDSRTRRWK